MYKRYIILMIIAAGAFLRGAAQQTVSPGKWQFHSINQVGLLGGEATTGLSVAECQWHAVPFVFRWNRCRARQLSLPHDPRICGPAERVWQGANKFFVYGDAGIHFAWLTDEQKPNKYLSYDDFSNGFYLDAGFGYKIKTGAKSALLLNLGYSYKYISEKTPGALLFYPAIYAGGAYNQTPTTDTYSYYLNRVSIKVGWEF